MPPASQSSETSAAAAAAAADEADSVREHAHNLVAMADMTIRSTEKVERKAVDGNFDESAVDFLLDGSDASNLDLGKDEGDASEDIRRAQRPAVVNPMEKAAAVPQKMQLPTTAAIIATASSTVPLTKMMGWTASRPRRHHLPLAGLARRRPVGAAAKEGQNSCRAY